MKVSKAMHRKPNSPICYGFVTGDGGVSHEVFHG